VCVSLCVGCNQCTVNPCSVKPLRWPVPVLPDERLKSKKELESFTLNKKQAQHFWDISASFSLSDIHTCHEILIGNKCHCTQIFLRNSIYCCKQPPAQLVPPDVTANIQLLKLSFRAKFISFFHRGNEVAGQYRRVHSDLSPPLKFFSL